MSQILAPEACELINKWEILSSKERGEKSGYVVGKYGADILLPGATAKAISKGVKDAKELAIIAKNLQNAEKYVILDALAETGGSSEVFADVVYSSRGIKDLPHSSEILKGLRNVSSITTKNDILNIFERNGELIGKKGTSIYIRLFAGGPNDAVQVFNELTKNGKLIHFDELRKVYQLSDEVYITYRSLSKSGPPTIDIKLPEMEHNIKLKFFEEK
ncbi:MAG: hypothetical protein HZB76_03910 [Chlamydiae bacterium]|nr:hypothetical protein [Chlamydiota bacterium]